MMRTVTLVSSSFTTKQEAFWAGNFGTSYIERNQGDWLLAANLDMFSKALRRAEKLSTCIEFGANIGMNLKALSLLFPELDSWAVEINDEAVERLGTVIPKANIHHRSLLD